MTSNFPPPHVPPGWYEASHDPAWAWHHDGVGWSGWQYRAGELVFVDDPELMCPPADLALVRRRTSTEEIAVGDVVRHPTFGLGVVLDTSGSGHTLEAMVRFQHAGVKHLALGWAKLEKVV